MPFQSPPFPPKPLWRPHTVDRKTSLQLNEQLIKNASKLKRTIKQVNDKGKGSPT